MDTLIASQTVFYIVSSLAIIAISILIVIVLYQLLGVIRNTRKVSEDVAETYTKAKKGFSKIINLIKK